MIRTLLALCLLPLAAQATPQLGLEVTLDPTSRTFSANAILSDDQALPGFALGPDFSITSFTVNGRPMKPLAPDVSKKGWYQLPPTSRRITLAYRGILEPLARLDHRQVLHGLPTMTAAEGSYLPSGSGWYPDPGTKFSYRLTLHLPQGQKGLVPGDLLSESDSSNGYRAEFAFPHPAEGIDLMAGPYAVHEHPLVLPSGRPIKVRTWFHEELAALAPDYLKDSSRYIERYSRLIGDYPFGLFSVVSSPLSTGFGMPSLTYLGRDVLKLPFIRSTSLGHEVLHNWWGNGVYPDWRRGNWSEGLTTFLADYAYKEDQGEAAAREMRLGWLRDLTAVPPAEDTALRDFVARHHGISSIVGYNKSAMVFSMLRDRIGREAFEKGLRLLWERKRFQSAAWSDLEAAFSAAAGRPLAGFFHQWVDRPGTPTLHLRNARQQGSQLRLTLTNTDTRALRVPLRLVYADRTEDRWVDLARRVTPALLEVKGDVRSVQLDPDYRIWRRLDPALVPAILREVFVAPRVDLVVVDNDPELQADARSLAERVLDVPPVPLAAEGPPGTNPLLLLGTPPAVEAWLARQGLPPRPGTLARAGTAQVWAGRDALGRPYVVVSAQDSAALKALERGLPHYGKQSWLVFEASRAVSKGTWPPATESVRVRPDGQ